MRYSMYRIRRNVSHNLVNARATKDIRQIRLIVFHGKDDIRVERSADLLYQGLMNVLRKKPLQNVTISDVSKASTVSRATFYRSFDEVADILTWRCDREFHQMLISFVSSQPDLSKPNVLLLYVLRHWMQVEHIELLEQLMTNNRLDILFNGFMNNTDIPIKYLETQGIHIDTHEHIYFNSLRAGMFMGIINAWITNGKRETPEEVTDIIYRQFSDIRDANLML